MGLESNLCDRVILKMGGKNVVRLWAVLGVNDDNLYINIIRNTTQLSNCVIISNSLVVKLEDG